MYRRKIYCAFAALLIICILCSCSKSEEYISEFFALDTYISVKIDAYGSASLADGVKEIVKEYEKKLSVTDESSQTAKLNKNKSAELDSDCVTLIKEAVSVSDLTGGCFDLTIYPAVKAWGFTGGENRIPTQNEIESLKEIIDYKNLNIKDSTVNIPESFEIDLGGCAKGFIGDKCAQYLEENGVKCAVISLGGNIRTVGEKSDGQRFKIGIEYPDKSGTFATVQTDDTNIITSGAYQRNFAGNDGKLYHHIIDPKTAKPAESDLASVTVISKNGTRADCLSTAFYVMGLDNAIDLVKNNDLGIEVIFLTENDKVYISSGIAEDFTLAEEYKDFMVNVIE